jgi:hypothetical protein
MKRSYIWNGSSFVEKSSSASKNIHYVQGDLAEFRTASGVQITGGRRQYREHLKESGNVEVGASEIIAMQEKWNSRQSDHRARVAKGAKYIREVETSTDDIRPYERSRMNNEVRNRLEGRPMPDRVTLIKMSLEEARRR